MNQLASTLQSLAQPQAWTGTASQLAAALNASGLNPSITAARLSMLLHKLEPELWWMHGLSIRFSRTGERRLIRLAKRGSRASSFMTATSGLAPSSDKPDSLNQMDAVIDVSCRAKKV